MFSLDVVSFKVSQITPARGHMTRTFWQGGDRQIMLCVVAVKSLFSLASVGGTEMAWFVRFQDRVTGPYSDHDFVFLVQSGKIAAETLVGKGAGGPWVPASTVKGLFAAKRSALSGPTAAPPPLRQNTPPRSLMASGSKGAGDHERPKPIVIGDACARGDVHSRSHDAHRKSYGATRTITALAAASAVLVALSFASLVIIIVSNSARAQSIKEASARYDASVEKARNSVVRYGRSPEDSVAEALAIHDVLESISNAKSLQASSQQPQKGFANLWDSSYERGEILLREGLGQYCNSCRLFSGDKALERQASHFGALIPSLSKEQAAYYSSPADLAKQVLEIKFESGSSVASMKNGGCPGFAELCNVLVLSDAQQLENIMSIASAVDIDDATKAGTIERIMSIESESKAYMLQLRNQ